MKSITAEQFVQILPALAPEEAVIDVREMDEFESAHIVKSMNLPLSSIGKGIEELKKYSKIYLLCESGGRSSYAHEILKTAEIETVDVTGGLMALRRLGVEFVEN
jgi:rhodanese-related sulfurtransferase